VHNLVKAFLRFYPTVKLSVVLPPGGVYVDRFRQLGVRVEEHPFDRLRAKNAPVIGALLRDLAPDVVHSHGKGAGLYVRMFARSTRRVRRVHSFHGLHPPSGAFGRGAYLLLESWLLRNTDALVASSASESEDIQQCLKSALGKIREIPHVIDAEETVALSKRELDGRLGSFLERMDDAFIVSMIARDDPVKNYSLALQVAARLLGTYAKVRFVFVGIHPEKLVVRELVRSFPERVFACEALENPAALIGKSHTLLLTSRKESSSMVSLEAFALGKPVVATNVQGIRDVVEHNYNGLLCDESADSVCAALESMMKSEELYRRLSEGASASGRRMNLKTWAKNYYDVYTGGM
jgi:glycosyltransferase involved in cell wall biosynthesis